MIIRRWSAVILLLIGTAARAQESETPSSQGPAEDCHCGEGMDEPLSPVPTRAYGGLAALDATRVVLVAVHATWLDKGPPIDSYRTTIPFRLTYTLRNPGPARAVRVGIRATWGDFERAGLSPSPSIDLVQAPPVRVDGKPFECTVERPEWRPHGPGDGQGYSVEAWCVGTLAVGAGTSTHVIEYEDRVTSRGHYWAALRHGFDAEATWAGPVATVDVTLPLGPLPGFPIVVGPPGHTDQGGVVRWHLAGPEVSRLPPVYVGMNTLMKRPAQLRTANRGYEFAASSTLAPEKHHRYDADRAIDGDGGSAWCKGVPGPGIGEWIEVRPRLDPALAARCWLIGFEVIPGVARDRALWLANNRVERLRLSSCSHPEEGVDVDLTRLKDAGGTPIPYSDNPGLGQFELEDDVLQGPAPGFVHVFSHERECFRLTILAVRKGRVDDTCIGEFLPLLSCTDGGRAYPIRAVR